MIVSRKNWQGYRNEITEFLDLYLIRCEGARDSFTNYIYEHSINNMWIIRVPGASRGYIEVEDGIVKGIKLHEDRFCYDRKVLNELDRFNGRKIDLK